MADELPPILMGYTKVTDTACWSMWQVSKEIK